jgi:type IV pilus assembly protein PilQ
MKTLILSLVLAASLAVAQTYGAEPATGATRGGARGKEAVKKDAETMTADFPNEDIPTLLRNIAEFYHLDLAPLPESVQGRITIRLRNVTWQEVFQAALAPIGHTFSEQNRRITVRTVPEKYLPANNAGGR